MTRSFAMIAIAVALGTLGTAAAVQSAGPFTDQTGPKLGPCPEGFDKLLPNCSIGTVITTDGQIKACHCPLPNLQLPASADEVIPVANQQEVYKSDLEVGKIDDKTNPKDPCDWIKINGVRRWVCW
jgi:hypothetical protein